MAQDRMLRVVELLNELVEDVTIDGERFEAIAEELRRIYSDRSFRHSYAELSEEISRLQPDQRDMLCKYVDLILNMIANQDGPNARVTIKFGKLCDHISLEHIRIARIEQVEYIGKRSTEELTEAGNDLEQTRTLVSELSEDVKGFHAQSITILGIFAGLVITFASVTQLVASGLANLNEIDAYKIVLFLSVAFLFLFNIIFFMMYSIAKISGKSIASRCEKRICSSCGQCKKSFSKVWKKYPYFVIGNIFALIVCIAIYRLNLH